MDKNEDIQCGWRWEPNPVSSIWAVLESHVKSALGFQSRKKTGFDIMIQEPVTQDTKTNLAK